MVLSGRVRSSNSCLPHVPHGVHHVCSVLSLPAFSQRSLHSFLYQCSSLSSFSLRLAWAAVWPFACRCFSCWFSSRASSSLVSLDRIDRASLGVAFVSRLHVTSFLVCTAYQDWRMQSESAIIIFSMFEVSYAVELLHKPFAMLLSKYASKTLTARSLTHSRPAEIPLHAPEVSVS